MPNDCCGVVKAVFGCWPLASSRRMMLQLQTDRRDQIQAIALDLYFANS
jgi:hypothetical protein